MSFLSTYFTLVSTPIAGGDKVLNLHLTPIYCRENTNFDSQKSFLLGVEIHLFAAILGQTNYTG